MLAEAVAEREEVVLAVVALALADRAVEARVEALAVRAPERVGVIASKRVSPSMWSTPIKVAEYTIGATGVARRRLLRREGGGAGRAVPRTDARGAVAVDDGS